MQTFVSGYIESEGDIGHFCLGSRCVKKERRVLRGKKKKKNTHTVKCPTGLMKRYIRYTLYLTKAFLFRFYFSFLHRIYLEPVVFDFVYIPFIRGYSFLFDFCYYSYFILLFYISIFKRRSGQKKKKKKKKEKKQGRKENQNRPCTKHIPRDLFIFLSKTSGQTLLGYSLLTSHMRESERTSP